MTKEIRQAVNDKIYKLTVKANAILKNKKRSKFDAFKIQAVCDFAVDLLGKIEEPDTEERIKAAFLSVNDIKD